MTAKGELLYEGITDIIIGAFYAVYNALGYGFLENVYCAALVFELRRRGLKVEREVPVQVFYAGQPIARYRVDLIVEGKVLLELKSSVAIGEADHRQVFNYLRCTDIDLGMILHFGPKPSFRRIICTDKQFTIDRS